MSVREMHRNADSTNTSNSSDPSKLLKKRKHDPDGKESTRKKSRTESTTNTPTIATEPSIEHGTKKKKNKSLRVAAKITSETENVADSQNTLVNGSATLRKDPESIENEEERVHFADDQDVNLLASKEPSPFYSTRLSLHVAVPAVAFRSSTSSLVTTHLTPLLLTYFSPAQGIVLGFSDPVLSTRPNTAINLPSLPPRSGTLEAQAKVLARPADDCGVCWVWLTATFLVFRPTKGDELYGWVNVATEELIGLVSYNYFQTGVGKARIPGSWKWSGPQREVSRGRKRTQKIRLHDEENESDTQQDDSRETDGTLVETPDFLTPLADDSVPYLDESGDKVKSTLKFRVVDTENVPAHDRRSWALHMNASLLDESAEKKLEDMERAKFQRAQDMIDDNNLLDSGEATMSGGLRRSTTREASVISRMSGYVPARHRLNY